MTVLTNAVAAGLPGRLAPYRYMPSIDPARFRGLTSDVLFALEYGPDGLGADTGAPQEYVEQLLLVLADWRQRLLDGRRADAGAYRAALDTVREAWLQYSFRWDGGPDIPYPFDLPDTKPKAVVEDGHRVPDCTGHCAQDETCSTELADLGDDTDGHLVAEVYAEPGQPVQAVVFTFGLRGDTTLLRTDDPAKLRAQADRLHEFASRISYGAHILDQLKKREAK